MLGAHGRRRLGAAGAADAADAADAANAANAASITERSPDNDTRNERRGACLVAAKGHTADVPTGGDRGTGQGPSKQRDQAILLRFLRTLCGLEDLTPPLNCGFASIHTLKRNSTTSPSAIT